MTAPTYAQLVAALDRVVRAHHAEADDRGGVAAVLNEIEASIADAAELAGRAHGASGSGSARRLSAPTGQPPQDDEPGRPPAHAGNPSRTPASLTPLT